MANTQNLVVFFLVVILSASMFNTNILVSGGKHEDKIKYTYCTDTLCSDSYLPHIGTSVGKGTMLETAVFYIKTEELVTNDNEDAREDSLTRKQVYVVDLSAENPNLKMDRNQYAQVGAVVGSSGNFGLEKNCEDVIDKGVNNNRRGFNGIGRQKGS
ncbi:hypothetical protein YC2023_057194 [Brassica napus]